MIKSPLKWAGGKTRVLPELLKHLPKADCLIEPFVGSGTVFMNTEYRRYVLCDSNRALINFFRALREDPERLILIARTYSEMAITKIAITKSASCSTTCRGMTSVQMITLYGGRPHFYT